MTKAEIQNLWPDWRIEFVCDYACEKLRNALGINFVYLRNDGWKPWIDEEDGEWEIALVFENKKNDSFTIIEAHNELFTLPELDFDKKTGANRIKDMPGKVIVRLAWHLKERWEKNN